MSSRNSGSKSKQAPGASGVVLQTETEKYRQKYKELKRKVREIEAQNDKLVLKSLTVKRNIQRLRLERAILYERLERNLHENQILDPNRISTGGSITGNNEELDSSRFGSKPIFPNQSASGPSSNRDDIEMSSSMDSKPNSNFNSSQNPTITTNQSNTNINTNTSSGTGTNQSFSEILNPSMNNPVGSMNTSSTTTTTTNPSNGWESNPSDTGSNNKMKITLKRTGY